MTTKSLREVKNNLSAEIERLPDSGPVLITKNGRTRALLIGVDEETDLESLLLSTNPRELGAVGMRSPLSRLSVGLQTVVQSMESSHRN